MCQVHSNIFTIKEKWSKEWTNRKVYIEVDCRKLMNSWTIITLIIKSVMKNYEDKRMRPETITVSDVAQANKHKS